MERLPYRVCQICKDWNGNITKCFNECGKPLDAIEELRKYKQLQDMIGIPFEEFAELCKEHQPNECKNPSKAIILTDESVDEWQQYKSDKEQGLILRLPCKVGDIFYCIAGEHVKRIHKMEVLDVNPFGAIYEEDGIIKIYNMYLDGNIGYLHCRFSDIGKTVFLTKEAAEQALKQMGE